LTVRWEERGSICSTIITDMRGKTCPICKKGWEVSAESFRNQFLVRQLDEWVHRTCYEGYLSMRETCMWSNLMCEPEDMIPFDWKKIPNEYGGAWGTDWYFINYLGYVPKLKVGSRKRVYHMSLHDLRREQIDAFLEKVKDENVTKGEQGNSSVYIHAWTEADAKRYLAHFWAVIRMDKPKPGSVCDQHEGKRRERLPKAQAA